MWPFYLLLSIGIGLFVVLVTVYLIRYIRNSLRGGGEDEAKESLDNDAACLVAGLCLCLVYLVWVTYQAQFQEAISSRKVIELTLVASPSRGIGVVAGASMAIFGGALVSAGQA